MTDAEFLGTHTARLDPTNLTLDWWLMADSRRVRQKLRRAPQFFCRAVLVHYSRIDPALQDRALEADASVEGLDDFGGHRLFV